MQVAIRVIARALRLDRHVTRYAAVEIFSCQRADAVRHMRAQSISDVHVFSGNPQRHIASNLAHHLCPSCCSP